MPTLRKLQEDFASHLFSNDSPVLDAISEGPLTPSEYMSIHRNNCFLTLKDVLCRVYPVVCRLVDIRFFDYAAHRFISAFPPASGNLNGYGEAFPEFLAVFPPAQTLAYLSDVARLEWALHAAYHASDAPAFDIEAFARALPESYPEMRITLHPSCRLVDSPYPILHIWEANRDLSKDPEFIALKNSGERILLLIQRHDQGVLIHTLEPGEYAFLKELQTENGLERSFNIALGAQADFDLQQVLIRNVSRGTLCRLTG